MPSGVQMTSIADRCANRAEVALALVPADLGAGGSPRQLLGPAPPSHVEVLRVARGGPSRGCSALRPEQLMGVQLKDKRGERWKV